MALVGHLDTVPNWDGGTTRVEGDRIVGRGTADMKGGVAVMLRLLERFAGARAASLVHVFYDREEGPNQLQRHPRVLADRRLLGRPRPSRVVLEPTSDTVHAGAVGTMNADVVYRGKPRTARGRGRASTRSTRPRPRSAGSPPARRSPSSSTGSQFHDTITVTLAHGGATRNVVPDEFRLAVNVRVAPGR